jgi:hypothetical protein
MNRPKLKTTQLSLKRLRNDGWLADVTERWQPATPAGFGGHLIRKDLFEFIDILAIHEQHGILAVQTTSFDGMRERLKKIARLQAAQVLLAAGGKIEVHGWAKVGGRFVCKATKYPTIEKL